MDLLEHMQALQRVDAERLSHAAAIRYLAALDQTLERARRRLADERVAATRRSMESDQLRLRAMGARRRALAAQREGTQGEVAAAQRRADELDLRREWLVGEAARRGRHRRAVEEALPRLEEVLRDARRAVPSDLALELDLRARREVGADFVAPGGAREDEDLFGALMDGPVALGDTMRRVLAASPGFAAPGEVTERVEAVAARLQAGRPGWERRRVTVLAGDDGIATAFTMPGRSVYLTWPLAARCDDEHALALVLGHELAHHDLGHLEAFHRRMTALPQVRAVGRAVWAWARLERGLHSPEWECEADAHGLALALNAGFDGARCLGLFDVLEQAVTDMGAEWMVDGPEFARYGEAGEALSAADKAKVWAWERAIGYLPLAERRRRLEARLAQAGQAAL